MFLYMFLCALAIKHMMIAPAPLPASCSGDNQRFPFPFVMLSCCPFFPSCVWQQTHRSIYHASCCHLSIHCVSFSSSLLACMSTSHPVHRTAGECRLIRQRHTGFLSIVKKGSPLNQDHPLSPYSNSCCFICLELNLYINIHSCTS